MIHQCETCTHHSSFLYIKGNKGEWQPICRAGEIPTQEGFCQGYDRDEKKAEIMKHHTTPHIWRGGGHSREYTAYTQLSQIARQHGVTLQTMAIIDDIQYALHEENQHTLTPTEFRQLYDEILDIDHVYSYDDTVRTLLTQIQETIQGEKK